MTKRNTEPEFTRRSNDGIMAWPMESDDEGNRLMAESLVRERLPKFAAQLPGPLAYVLPDADTVELEWMRIQFQDTRGCTRLCPAVGVAMDTTPGLLLAVATNDAQPGLDDPEPILAKGTRIEKAHSDPGDLNSNGARGSVSGSVVVEPHMPTREVVYFITWDDLPDVSVLCRRDRFVPLEGE